MNSIAILTYHSIDHSKSVISISPDTFADQMAIIAEAGYRGISLREAVATYRSTGTWPSDSIVVTFDDGYENFHQSAFQTLNMYGFTATVFLITGHADGWNDWGPHPPGMGKERMLTWNQIEEMASAGIEIGAHTRTHRDLRQLSPTEVRDEIVSSRDEIAERIGGSVESFAYPFGYISPESAEIVGSEFNAGCSTVLRRASTEALNLLPRVDIYYLRPRDRFERAIRGELDSWLTIRRWARAFKHLYERAT